MIRLGGDDLQGLDVDMVIEGQSMWVESSITDASHYADLSIIEIGQFEKLHDEARTSERKTHFLAIQQKPKGTSCGKMYFAKY